MEKRYKIIITLLVIIIVILTGIIIYLATRPTVYQPIRPTGLVGVPESSSTSSQSQTINILGNYTATVEDSTVKLTRNSKGEVIEISNILGDTPKGLTTLADGKRFDYQLAPITINFYNEKQPYPGEDMGFFKQPDVEKITIDNKEYTITKYVNGEGLFYGNDGIKLDDETKANCPNIKEFSTGYNQVQKYLELPNNLFIVISYNDSSEFSSKTCIQTETEISPKTYELTNQILRSIKKN